MSASGKALWGCRQDDGVGPSQPEPVVELNACVPPKFRVEAPSTDVMTELGDRDSGRWRDLEEGGKAGPRDGIGLLIRRRDTCELALQPGEGRRPSASLAWLTAGAKWTLTWVSGLPAPWTLGNTCHWFSPRLQPEPIQAARPVKTET